MVVRNSSDVQNIRALEEQQDYLPLQMALLRQAGVSTGYQVSIGAVDYVVSEVQGQILDQTGDYIFLRSSAGVQKVSMAEFYVQIMDRLPSGFMANARSLVRSGGRLTRSLSAGPLGAILEMTITPTMA
ncbi:MAG: hypothetical protein HRT44_07320, partial [Bdellovibrionales bacterium]|nr:hypothetical protein [Bdellovibrionales bacterium]NQZ19047.1 hypothetical protein [Bdellovibrionales bacterium]